MKITMGSIFENACFSASLLIYLFLILFYF